MRRERERGDSGIWGYLGMRCGLRAGGGGRRGGPLLGERGGGGGVLREGLVGGAGSEVGLEIGT